jgi:hypothetical protein
MYWPAFARTGELVERRMRADTDTRPLVVLDPRGAADHAALDAAVRAAASLAVHLARQGGCALLLPGDRRPTALEPTLAAWEHAHARLAVVTGVRGPNVAGLAARRGPVFYVAASAPRRPPRALTHAPGGGRILVVPGHACRAAAPIFSVAGCAAYELSGQRARRGGGVMGAHAVRFGAPGAAPREAPATGPLASPGVARLVGFVPLAGFGALQWGALLTPKADGSLLLGVLAATAAGGLLLATGRDSRRGVRIAGMVGAPSACSSSRSSSPACRCGCSSPPDGTTRLRLGQGIESFPRSRCPTGASTSGCASRSSQAA